MPAAAARPRAALSLEYLCEILERAKVLTPEQRSDAIARADVTRARLVRQRAGGGRKRGVGATEGVHPAEVIVALGLGQGGDARLPLTERMVMQSLAQHVGLPFVDLDPLKIDAKLAPQLLSRPFARRHAALVIAADERTVTVAVADPLDRALVEALEEHVRREPRLVIATPSEIQRLITDIYGFRGAVDAAEQQASAVVDIGNLERYVKLKRVEEIEASDSHVISAVEYLLHYALDQRASDIHIEPRREQSVVRMRIDGVLHNVHTLPKVVHTAIVSRVKTLARLDIAEKRRPQDGRIKTARGDREVEMRVSTIAVAFGEKLVIRVFDPECAPARPVRSRNVRRPAAGRRSLPGTAARPPPRDGSDRERQDDHPLRGAAVDRDARGERRDRRRPDRNRGRRTSTRSPSSQRSASLSPTRFATSCGRIRT